jgi:hypothetical protein
LENDKLSEKSAEKVNLLNSILDDLIIDASDLVKDLYAGVRNYLMYGLVMILFGVSEIASNMELLQERMYIPVFVAGCLLFAGFAQIFVYFRLRRKYSKLFEAEMELKKL